MLYLALVQGRKYRILFLRLAFVPIIFVAMFVGRPWKDESLTDFLVEWLGYAFLLAGMAIRLWSTMYIGGRKSKELVTEGPYSMCRNPLYVGTILLCIGASLCLENVLMLVASLAIIVPVHALVTMAEEHILERRFGSTFQAYKRTVPRFIPSFRNWRSREEVLVSTRVIRRAAFEASGILLIPVLGDLIENLRRIGVLPVLWRFP